MAKQLSTLDLHHLLKEIIELKDSRIDKFYNIGKEEIFIQLHKSNIGKKILRIISGKSLFLTETKFSDEKPSHFCMVLRRKLEGKILSSIIQIEPERILEFNLKSKDEAYKLYIELFGKGNLILCDGDGIIMDSLIRQKFKDRSILPKLKYEHPVMEHNLFSINLDIVRLLRNSKKDKIVTTLATELGLGGVYSEEVCLLSKIDKGKDPKKINEKEITLMLKSIQKLISNQIKAQIIYKDKDIVDVVPFDLEIYKDYEKKIFDSYSEVLDFYFTNLNLTRKDPSKYENQINEIKRILEEQETALEDLNFKAKENREKAESIYNNYQLIKEILEEINKAKEKHSWKEIKQRLKGHKIVRDIDIKDKRIIIDI